MKNADLENRCAHPQMEAPSAALRLARAEAGDFERVKAAYLDIIDHSPDMRRYARWEYGKHPSDESILEYIDGESMYMLLDGPVVAGVAAITPGQGEEYRPVRWQVDARDDEVMTLHLLGIVPGCQRTGVGRAMMRKVFAMAAEMGLKALRLDTFTSNTPARRFYESLGFVCCGQQRWYTQNAGWMDFCLYEYALQRE